MHLFTSLLIFLGISSSFVIAGTIDPNTPDSKYLEFGQQFKSVVRIRAIGKCDNPQCDQKEHEQFGSGVIIAPNWILTAAHVLKDTREPVVIRDGGQEYRLQHVILHHEFVREKIGLHDLALGYTSEDFKLNTYTPLYTGADELGKAITISGYGMHGTFTSGSVDSDGKKRGGHNVIDGKERTVLVCSPTPGIGRMPLEFMLAPGDSGGGMFIGDKLAGINSFVMATDKKPNGTYGDESAFTRVSMYVDWVHSQMRNYELALKAQVTTHGDIKLADFEAAP
jgi:hypothetical protein